MQTTDHPLIAGPAVGRPGHEADDVLARACREELPRLATRRPGVRPEMRDSLRLGFDCPVRWSIGGVDRMGTARDVSETGAGFTVRALSRPHVGQSLRLVFELDDEYEWIVDNAAVVTRCDPCDDGLCEVGVRLGELNL